jgi:hypothetical protein
LSVDLRASSSMAPTSANDPATLRVVEGTMVTECAACTNHAPVAQGMVAVDVALPGGLDPDVASLDRLLSTTTAGGAYAGHYELHPARAVIYVATIAAGGVAKLAFDAVARFPGRYTARASCAFPFYGDGKSWSETVSLEISPAHADM